MNTEKLQGVLTRWNELRGFGFVASRKENGQRRTWFLHASRIESIEGGGIPQPGCDVLFNEEDHPQGPLAVDVEILSPAMKIAAARIAKTLNASKTEVPR